jgi:sugar phosphate isomerase/epimerase
MFRLSVITDEVSQDLEAVSKFAKSFNLDGIEIRNVWGRAPQDLLEESDRIRKILAKYELEVSAIASPFFKADLKNHAEYTKHLEILERCIKLAKNLETDIIRGFTFWRDGSLNEHIDEIVEKFQKPLEMIEAEGVVLGIENEPSTLVGNGRELDQFLNRIGSKSVKAVWDPGNDIWDPSGEIPYPDGYSHVRDKIIHVHIKDGVRKEGGKHQWVPFGEGEVDYRGQLMALKNDGYSGYLSLETHWRLKKQLPRDLVVKPGWEEFSRLGEESSRICMKNLQDMLREIQVMVG